MASVKYRIDSIDHLEELFNHVNTHLTLIESAHLTYDQEPISDDPKLKIPKERLKPIMKRPEEYLAKFLPETKTVTTKLIGHVCSICIDILLPGDKYRDLECKHYFHQTCIDEWMMNNFDDLSCPLCRCSQYQYKDSVFE